MSDTRLIRLTELTQSLGIGKTKLYSLIKEGEFPKPIKIGKLSRWRRESVEKWLDCRSETSP